MTGTLPPKPEARAEKVSLWGHFRAFRRDILSAQPARLYRAWMAEFRTPFFESYLCNDPALVRLVLDERPGDFPKSDRVTEGLRPLLGRSVFVTNGEEWLRQRRIIDPAFEGGRLKEAFPAIWAASEAAVARMDLGEVELELAASNAAADVIFRTLFSIPIEDRVAQAVFQEFRAYQRSAPILNLGAFLPLPRWMPRLHRGATKRSARAIRGLIEGLTAARAVAISEGRAPDDLATKIMTTADPVTGEQFGTEEMVDQVAIFFLAGHETSASALGWALYLLATHPEAQERVAAEAEALRPEFRVVGSLRFTRDVFREALRLYPPVPMLVRETTRSEKFRGRKVRRGAQVVISPWHLHRHERLWENPDAFDPDRWVGEVPQGGYLPFSRGPRVCPGAGFAMLEGTLMLAHLVRAFRFEAVEGKVPVPVAHLTVRARDGIWLRISRR
jgi:cytochrome P450